MYDPLKHDTKWYVDIFLSSVNDKPGETETKEFDTFLAAVTYADGCVHTAYIYTVETPRFGITMRFGEVIGVRKE